MSRDIHDGDYLARVEANRIIQAAAMQPHQAQPQMPVVSLFIQGFYGVLYAIMTEPETLPQDAVDMAWDTAERAFYKLGFELVLEHGTIGAKAVEKEPQA